VYPPLNFVANFRVEVYLTPRDLVRGPLEFRNPAADCIHLMGAIERGLRQKCLRNLSKEGRFRALGRSRGAKADLSDGPSMSRPAGGLHLRAAWW
jgi:hypothetical protein